MTTSPEARKTQNQIQLEEEPPSGIATAHREAEEEPPGKPPPSNKNKFFSHVSEEDWQDWKWHFRNRITSISKLTEFVPLSAKEQTQVKLVAARYPFAITPYYLSLIDINDPGDPVKKQAIPCFQEVALADMGSEDPLEEKRDTVVPGLVHRYQDRVLMVLTDICPMYCRHCTRKREWQNGGWVRSPAQIEAMLDYIRRTKTVRDVILSGGDPLTLSTRRLEEVISSLRKIPHVEIIRIGSRYPVVLPQRIDDEMCAMLSKYGPIWVNTHFNHSKEVTTEAAHACDSLLRAGVPVNNQSVLLKGINDSVEAQLQLCQALLRIKVRPYYLFECDEVQGTEHFRTPVQVGINIMEGLRGHISGLAIPTFVIDLPQGGGKVPLQPNYVLSHTEEELVLKNYQGHLFHFRNPANSEPIPVRVNRRSQANTNRAQLTFSEIVSPPKEKIAEK